MGTQGGRWHRPELVVIVRGRSEESVLGFCKGSGLGSDSYSNDEGCYLTDLVCEPCATEAWS